MCGIWSILNKDPNTVWEGYGDALEAGKPRGPEQTDTCSTNQALHVFHRLAINGLDDASMMPLDVDDCVLICNGEIYNYTELCEILNVTPKTKNDCEIIIHLYRKVGIQRCAEMLDGEFAFVLQDKRVGDGTEPDKMFFVRDPYGVRPLFLLTDETIELISVASEVKVLHNLTSAGTIRQVTPGTVTTVEKSWRVNSKWQITGTQKYHNVLITPSTFGSLDETNIEFDKYFAMIIDAFEDAVRKRVTNTDRPVACLLSGGLDSSLVAAVASHLHEGTLKTYAIGFEGSEDLKMAQIVANHIGSDHESIVVSEKEFLDAIPEVVKAIESYDTTTVRASVGNYMIAKKIAEIGREKVILNGDGSDELTGGYMYFMEAPDDVAFDAECRRLLDNIHYFDVLRSDRSVSSHGLEPRTPFLDKTFVQTYLSIPACLRNPISKFNKSFSLWDRFVAEVEPSSSIAKMITCRTTKLLLRAAFHRHCNGILPDNILWRMKEAFSDGVSNGKRSWFESIQEHVDSIDFDVDSEINAAGEHMTPVTREQAWYRKLFCDEYPGRDSVIPYFWMPRWVEATDASARTLTCYKAITKDSSQTESHTSNEIIDVTDITMKDEEVIAVELE